MKKYWYIASFLVSSLIFWRWLSFRIFVAGDYTYYFNPALREWFVPTTWSTVGIGSVNLTLWTYPFHFLFSLLASWGLSYEVIDKILVLGPVALFSGLIAFWFVSLFTKKEYAAFFGSIILFFNTYYFSIITQGQINLLLAAMVGVLALGFFIKNKDLELKNIIICSSLLAATGFIDFRVAYIVLFLIGLYSMLEIILYSDFRNEKKKILIDVKHFLIVFSLFVIFNLFWLVPQVLMGTVTSNEILSRGLFGGTFFNSLESINLFFPFWTGSHPIWFMVQPIPIYFFLISIGAWMSIVFNKRKYIFFAAITALMGIFLAKQEAAPFTNTYLYLYNHLPGFNAFREASKFYLLTAIGYSILLASLLEKLNLRVKKRIVILLPPALIFCVFILTIYPIVTGSIGSMFIPRSMNADYLKLANSQAQDSNSYRSLWIPGAVNWSYSDQKHEIISVGDFITLISQQLNIQTNIIQNSENISLVAEPLLKSNFSDSLLSIIGTRYFIVPPNDSIDRPFEDYGGKNNSNIRQVFINQLDSTPWLKRVDIGTTDLVVYENPSYKPPIFAFNNLYHLNSIQNLDNKYDFITNTLKGDFYFTTTVNATNAVAEVGVSDVFEGIGSQSLHSVTATITASSTDNDYAKKKFYTNPANAPVYASLGGGEVSFYRKLGTLSAGSSVVVGAKQFIKNVAVPNSNSLYVGLGDSLFTFDKNSMLNLGRVTSGQAKVFTAGANVVPNGSFESGLWQPAVGDCNNYDNNAKLGMHLDTADASDGKQLLELDAANHIACTGETVVAAPGEYVFSFDYQSPNATAASFYIGFNNPVKTIVSKLIPISDASWHHHTMQLTVPKDSTSFELDLYSRSVDGTTNIINRYDAVSLQILKPLASIDLSTSNEFNHQSISLSADTSTVSYIDSHYNLTNVLSNGSFEQGLWSTQVGDCNNYDNDGLVGMRLNTQDTNTGSNSLELSATRHFACTGTSVAVRGGATYMVSFDYQSPNAKVASYYLDFNDASSTVYSEDVPITDTKWHTFSRTITAPLDASGLNITLYAKESDGSTNIINHYDNVQVVDVPNLVGTYYLVSDPGVTLKEPASITYDLINPTKKLVHIKGATTPFYLAMSESYHPQWQLQFNNSKVNGFLNSWVPFVKPDRIPDEYHYKLDDFLNGWYVDTGVYCTQNATLCTKNADGSYDMEMVVEFFPQRWFYLGLIVSGTTLAGCLGYLGYLGVKRIKIKIKQKNEKDI